jgi:hypothetical protein
MVLGHWPKRQSVPVAEIPEPFQKGPRENPPPAVKCQTWWENPSLSAYYVHFNFICHVKPLKNIKDPVIECPIKYCNSFTFALQFIQRRELYGKDS